eukprot:TRINITY_DN37149_c0_g1_i1.p1 TRINITY_DN37149_c0_g1~~TRINITY_DN37149_c0_g1_i1.p1  ORF type:complete len:191 (+),score=26.07 TRINITY_DN37149_c0_g1_i1:23-574(+)
MDIVVSIECFGDITVDIDMNDTVGDLKRKVGSMRDIEASVLMLQHDGEILGDELPMSETGVGCGEVVQLLIAGPQIAMDELALLGVDITQEELHQCAQLGNAEVLRLLLLTEQLDPNFRSMQGITPLMAASVVGCLECITLLYDSGADPEVSFIGLNAFDLASHGRHTSCMEFLKTHKKRRKI